MDINLNKVYHVYFLGIGGIGMSALARYFLSQRIAVSGYDLTPSSMTKALEQEGADIHYREAIELIPPKITQEKEFSLVIYTPAIPKQHKELVWLKNEGCRVLKRSEALGLISKQFKTIAVSGTHGKTTTSSMIAHVLNQSSVGTNAFLGGVSTNLGSNILLNEKSPYAVVEADEFDRSFLTLSPYITVCTSTDADHLDIYGNHKELLDAFQQFVNQTAADGLFISHESVDLIGDNKVNYGLDNGDIHVSNIKVEDGHFVFTAKTNTFQIENIQFGVSGLHNVENALATIGVCQAIGVSDEEIKNGLESYKGVKRRFEYHIQTPEKIFIDDYAHHPKEIKALVSSVRELFPDKKITGVFQPHLYSRTKDFADDFAKELSKLDQTILLDIYPARELPMEGVTSEWLRSKLTNKSKLISKEKLINDLINDKNEVVLTIGAGDIDRLVEPIKEALLKQHAIQQ